MENGPAKTERTRRSRAEIAELIATYRQSGQKQREFCQQRDIGLSTLQNYLRREGLMQKVLLIINGKFDKRGGSSPRYVLNCSGYA